MRRRRGRAKILQPLVKVSPVEALAESLAFTDLGASGYANDMRTVVLTVALAAVTPAVSAFLGAQPAPPAAVVRVPPEETGRPLASLGGGADFSREVRALFRVVACSGDEPLPPNIDRKVVDEHCAIMRQRFAKYQQTWIRVAQPFIAKLKPEGLPATVVYPFGGGDLLSALTTYPDAGEITTLSLEHAGDPRRVFTVNSAQLRASLENIRYATLGLLTANDSKTVNLQKVQRGELPGQLSFFLCALAVHGYRPVSLRYVKIQPDGMLRGVTQEDIAATEGKNAQLLNKVWVSPDFSESFSDYEMVFVKDGPHGYADLKTHRHFARNLDDTHVAADKALTAHLERKAPIVAMTKAASYLLWREDFSRIRNYLLTHMEFMVSDSTGIPVRYAAAAGFRQTAYGRFAESFLGAASEHNADFRKLWANAPPLPFRYGYIDKASQYHMMVTQRATAPK